MDARELQVALVHDWLTGMRGGEKCLEVFCRRFPKAPLLTLLHDRGRLSPVIDNMQVTTSFLQRLPLARRFYRQLLPLMPRAIERMQPPACDVVLSFSHCVAKGIQPPPDTPHVCYCFTPVRYAWHLEEDYLASMPAVKRVLARRILGSLRAWDRATAQRVTHFVAISMTVQRRIWEAYGRGSTVVYPPVDVDFYQPARGPREDYYLVVSALAPYKRVDLAIEACTRTKRRLVVIGAGPEMRRLQALAGPTVTLLGWQTNEVIRDHLQRCRALLFPGEEDFGIVPVEANACGAPVIALARGGATETILPHGSSASPTGWWFDAPGAEGVIEAMDGFEHVAHEFSPHDARRQALNFTVERFESELMDCVLEVAGRAAWPRRQAA